MRLAKLLPVTLAAAAGLAWWLRAEHRAARADTSPSAVAAPTRDAQRFSTTTTSEVSGNTSDDRPQTPASRRADELPGHRLSVAPTTSGDGARADESLARRSFVRSARASAPATTGHGALTPRPAEARAQERYQVEAADAPVEDLLRAE